MRLTASLAALPVDSDSSMSTRVFLRSGPSSPNVCLPAYSASTSLSSSSLSRKAVSSAVATCSSPLSYAPLAASSLVLPSAGSRRLAAGFSAARRRLVPPRGAASAAPDARALPLPLDLSLLFPSRFFGLATGASSSESSESDSPNRSARAGLEAAAAGAADDASASGA